MVTKIIQNQKNVLSEQIRETRMGFMDPR